MSISNARQSWLSSHSSHGSNFQSDRHTSNPPRIQTPINDSQRADSAAVVHEDNTDEDALKALFKDLYKKNEAKHAALFRGTLVGAEDDVQVDHIQTALPATERVSFEPVTVEMPKKPTRVIDEDNYDDEEEEEDEDEAGHTVNESPLKNRSTNTLSSPPRTIGSPIPSDKSSTKTLEKDKDIESQDQPKTSEDARKQLEESKKATEEAVKRSFHTKFYTLENDRIAMLEQQRLDESETQVDAEIEHGRNSGSGSGANAETQLGTLSSANLGTASLTLKHLIARIDQKRELVKASDAELRTLMNEVRKNRSKWANEDQIGQEELYEAAEKVLNELKAMTEYSTPFLQRVNKRDAPDYYNIIKQPMDFSAMTKKLKSTAYRSKAEFVTDLELIWGNCLKYNADLGHALRRNANMMKKESEKLIPLIPDITIKSRAEVEAEERRRGEDNGEESDDEPIMSSRGRKPGVKGASKTRGAPVGREESTPGVENKPVIQVNGLRGSHLGSGSSDAGIEGSQSGFATPPIPGTATPIGMNGVLGHGDSMDLDGAPINGSILQALGAAAGDLDEDEEYKIWKQVTKKDRARVAKERHKLFKGDRLNPDEPALLRTKAGMRRLLRQQKQARAGGSTDDSEIGAAIKGSKDPVETLAEGMDGEEERMLPDYYDPVNMIPDINPKLQWIEDADSQLIDPSDEFLRMVPKGYFTAPQGTMTAKIESNMKQMQETRKLCSKIGVIKQMQLQSQMYNNQFQKYCPEPFTEADIEPQTVAIEGAVMSSWTCHAALQRSVGKLCYHAGFEELQPSALDAITDLAADFFSKIAKTFSVYSEAPKVPATGALAEKGQKWQAAFTNEEIALHTLSENGFDVESLDSYAKDEMDKLGSKLGVMHERMKAHLTDLLRPALQDAGPDGAGAFKDGSDQFIGGDFAEDLDEDFFGFKELGLMEEFGLSSLSVPLHLLQTKLHQGYQAQNPLALIATAATLESLPPFEPVTIYNIESEIGLVQEFFKEKLRRLGDGGSGNREGVVGLVEDEDLPQKQRFPKPRLPPTGKITSPRKRPLREQIGNAKKKKKLENGLAMETRDSNSNQSQTQNANANSSQSQGKGVNGEKRDALTASAKKLKSALIVNGNGIGNSGGGGGGVGALDLDGGGSGSGSGGEKDDIGMMSPESLER